MATGNKPWTLLLTLESQRKKIQLSPQATLADLYQAASSAYSSGSRKKNAIAMSLQQALPPRRILPNCNETSLQKAGLQANDRVIVTVASKTSSTTTTTSTTTSTTKSKKKTATAKKKKAPAPKKTAAAANNDQDEYQQLQEEEGGGEETTTTASTNTRRKRSQRAAAQRATESFADTMKQQDLLMAAAATTRPKKATTARRQSPARQQQPRFSATSAGRRLHDGAVLTPAKKRRKTSKTTTKATATTPSSSQPSDPALALLAATNEPTRGAQLMRAGWRQAVQDAFEQNKAVARVAAVTSGDYELRVLKDDSSSLSHQEDSVDMRLQVKFAKGVQGRGYFEETVEGLPRAVVQSVIQAIHPTEALRPQNLALLSPRVFWSVLYHVTTHTTAAAAAAASAVAANTNSTIEQALQELQPELDWSFLRRRKQQLSAKARENLRQQQQGNNEDGQDWEAAAAAMESVEVAMGDLQALERQSKQSRAAAAASNRMADTEADVFVIVTPNETDLDELEECCDCQNNSTSRNNAKEMAKALHGTCHIHNWRELANASALELASTLHVDQETVQGWIDAAQVRTVDELMVEICQGNIAAVQALAAAKSATPKDLAVWRGIADVLREQLPTSSESAVAAAPTTTKPAIDDLEQWCQCAQQALEQLEWLNWYVTPVEKV